MNVHQGQFKGPVKLGQNIVDLINVSVSPHFRYLSKVGIQIPMNEVVYISDSSERQINDIKFIMNKKERLDFSEVRITQIYFERDLDWVIIDYVGQQ